MCGKAFCEAINPVKVAWKIYSRALPIAFEEFWSDLEHGSLGDTHRC
jgi:hypothetical protein